MKFLVILALALVAQGYASSHYQSAGSRGRNSPSSSEEDYSDSRHQQKWQNWDRELDEILDESLSATSHQFQSSASRMPQAESFKNKITHRLNGSDSLTSKPELKRKLIKMADQKLEKCKTPSGEELDKHCVGRATGQMMQLIAAVENVNRNPIVHNRRSSDY